MEQTLFTLDLFLVKSMQLQKQTFSTYLLPQTPCL